MLLAMLTSVVIAVAQPSNDECDSPINIPDVTSFCSNNGAFTNAGATPSSYGPANCFGATTQNDVWFSFVAEATDVTITVRGATAASPGGTLVNPAVAIYYGTCGGIINELECQAAPTSANVVEAYQGGLFVGSTYLVRIQGAAGATGTFQLCVNNYNPPVDPTSDCPQASILCDKSPFVVQSVMGAGSDITELNDASCFNNGAPTNYESNSTWFVWSWSQSGTLTFSITPNNGPDDLDFVVYRLPNGIGNCQGKQVLRCMASGQSQFVNSSACLGPTGLRFGDPDVSEDAGCSDPGDDAWLAPLDMIAGETYALCVNNFSETGNGFGVEFGGTGEFLGPTAQFLTNPPVVCLGTSIQVIDASVFPLGAITEWSWSFGADAIPGTSMGQGPHDVTFTTPGQHSVVLTVKTDLGCKVTDIQNVLVNPDVEVDQVIAAPDCNGGTNGAIEITNIQAGTPPYQFSWDGGPFTSDNTLTGLTVGTYNLVIKDANNCDTELDVLVKELELTVSPDITPPLCTGDANGVVTLNVTNGTGPYLFDWGGGLEPSNTMGGFSAGSYTVFSVDFTLCKGSFDFTVVDNPPVTLQMDTIDVTCFGANDGVGIAIPGGGVGGFSYLWSTSQTEAEAEGLPPGQYSVTASDANDCSITGAVFITEPAELFLTLIGTKDLLCNGIPTGEIEVSANGGREPYEFSADGINFQPGNVLTQLFAGNYNVIVRDASGCTATVPANLMEPLALTVVADPTDTLVDLGYLVQTSTATGPSGRPVTFMWTPVSGALSCNDCPNPLITATDDQVFVVKITDQDGCMDSTTVSIRVNKLRPVYFPNIFDPEKGVFPNNFFTGFSGPAATQLRLFRVYDRWGALVYEGANMPLNDPSIGWNGLVKGQKANPGVYTWYALVGFVDGVEIQYDGNITLIR